jgi:hypothetical protein
MYKENKILNFRCSLGLLHFIFLIVVLDMGNRMFVWYTGGTSESKDIKTSYFALCRGINIADFSGKELSDTLEFPPHYLKETSWTSVLMDEDLLLSTNDRHLWNSVLFHPEQCFFLWHNLSGKKNSFVWIT